MYGPDGHGGMVFADVVSFLRLSAAREESATLDIAEATVLKFDSLLSVLSAIRQSIPQDPRREQDLLCIAREVQELSFSLARVRSRWTDLEAGIQPRSRVLDPQQERSGRPGRPKITINKQQILFLRELRFTWSKIAAMYGISRKTLYNIRQRMGMREESDGDHTQFTSISDADLQEQMQAVKLIMPDAGQSMIRGVLLACGLNVPLSRLQECISVVDPINTALRWATPIHRRRYAVEAPNSLWHIDGNHKLVRYHSLSG